jgi:glutamyl-tRNA synthetase
VIVDFYEQVGYLPEAILNYLVLLGWSLDDKTETLTVPQMIEHFSLERVNKAPASFDPKKLWAFQDRTMQQVPIKAKVAKMVPYLQRAGLLPTPAPCEVGPLLTRIVEAAGDRIKVFGDILDYAGFFVPDERLEYDDAALDKRIRQPVEAAGLLARFKDRLASCDPFDSERLEKLLQGFVAQEGISSNQIIHALRIAVTGKPVGFGLFDTLAILGRERVVARIDRTLQRLVAATP